RLPTNNTNGYPSGRLAARVFYSSVFMIRRSLTEPKSNGFSFLHFILRTSDCLPIIETCESHDPRRLRGSSNSSHNVQSFHLETDLQREISVIRFCSDEDGCSLRGRH
ncbi:hypothetical protein PGTUg99_003366, partial [Puccinia graminis f. sp. tritici]